MALGPGSKGPACQGQEATDPTEEVSKPASAEHVRVNFTGQIEGLRSGRGVSK